MTLEFKRRGNILNPAIEIFFLPIHCPKGCSSFGIDQSFLKRGLTEVWIDSSSLKVVYDMKRVSKLTRAKDEGSEHGKIKVDLGLL